MKWSERMESIDLGDKKFYNRLINLLDILWKQSDSSIPIACKG